MVKFATEIILEKIREQWLAAECSVVQEHRSAGDEEEQLSGQLFGRSGVVHQSGNDVQEQPSGGGDQQVEKRLTRKRKELSEEEAIDELKARKVRKLRMKIKLFEQMIAALCARRQANAEMEDNPTVEEMITKGLAERKRTGGA